MKHIGSNLWFKRSGRLEVR